MNIEPYKCQYLINRKKWQHVIFIGLKIGQQIKEILTYHGKIFKFVKGNLYSCKEENSLQLFLIV